MTSTDDLIWAECLELLEEYREENRLVDAMKALTLQSRLSPAEFTTMIKDFCDAYRTRDLERLAGELHAWTSTIDVYLDDNLYEELCDSE